MIHALVQNVTDWDIVISIHILNWKRLRLIDWIMLGASYLGDGYFYGFIGLILLIFGGDTARQMLLSGLIAFAVELPVHAILKHTTKRSRPFNRIPDIRNRIKPADKFSFPSGHTAAAFLIATLFSSAFPGLLLPLFGVAFLIGFSRIYNGVHFTTDVIAGMILGILCTEIGLAII